RRPLSFGDSLPVKLAFDLVFHPNVFLPAAERGSNQIREAAMTKTLSLVAVAVLSAIATQAFGQNEGFQPVTSDMLANPPPGDWLMINRTYDEQRFSPIYHQPVTRRRV